MTEQGRLEVGSDGWALYREDGSIAMQDSWPGGREPAPDFGACDCCERLPAGTTARVLALLDPDHPAARTLRAAADPEDASDAP